ncbi:MAG: hypothetical protein QNK37_20685 [Acidobacteriota bacterium]|nr:hypothetical protein [Acidobacteriota bacterium]
MAVPANEQHWSGKAGAIEIAGTMYDGIGFDVTAQLKHLDSDTQSGSQKVADGQELSGNLNFALYLDLWPALAAILPADPTNTVSLACKLYPVNKPGHKYIDIPAGYFGVQINSTTGSVVNVTLSLNATAFTLVDIPVAP